MRYKVTIKYDGSKFHGFQRQKDCNNVQSTIEEFLSRFYEEDILIKGAGRTDKGVHAYGQVFHFDTMKGIKGLKKKFNKQNEFIKIRSIKKVSNDFHARHSAIKKIYIYKISTVKRNEDYYLNVYNNIDINKMRVASKEFIGKHDFRNFTSGLRDNYNQIIYKIKIIKVINKIYIIYIGSGFYRYMVRNITGALIHIGKNKCDINKIRNLLLDKDSKRLPTSKQGGLYLYKIYYK